MYPNVCFVTFVVVACTLEFTHFDPVSAMFIACIAKAPVTFCTLSHSAGQL